MHRGAAARSLGPQVIRPAGKADWRICTEIGAGVGCQAQVSWQAYASSKSSPHSPFVIGEQTAGVMTLATKSDYLSRKRNAHDMYGELGADAL